MGTKTKLVLAVSLVVLVYVLLTGDNKPIEIE
jgi:hypothetical protein